MSRATAMRHSASDNLSQDPGVGRRLKEIRYRTAGKNRKPYTQEEVADIFKRKIGRHMDQSSIKNYETGRRATPHDVLVFYAGLVEGYTVDYILTGKHPDPEGVVKRVMAALK